MGLVGKIQYYASTTVYCLFGGEYHTGDESCKINIYVERQRDKDALKYVFGNLFKCISNNDYFTVITDGTETVIVEIKIRDIKNVWHYVEYGRKYIDEEWIVALTLVDCMGRDSNSLVELYNAVSAGYQDGRSWDFKGVGDRLRKLGKFDYVRNGFYDLDKSVLEPMQTQTVMLFISCLE